MPEGVPSARPRPVAALILSSGAPQRVYSALNLANNCAGFGMEVVIFCTFDGLDLLVKGDDGRSLILSSPFPPPPTKGVDVPPPGAAFVTLEEQLTDAVDLGVRFLACDQSMAMRGLDATRLIDGVIIAGAGTYVAQAKHAALALFI